MRMLVSMFCLLGFFHVVVAMEEERQGEEPDIVIKKEQKTHRLETLPKEMREKIWGYVPVGTRTTLAQVKKNLFPFEVVLDRYAMENTSKDLCSGIINPELGFIDPLALKFFGIRPIDRVRVDRLPFQYPDEYKRFTEEIAPTYTKIYLNIYSNRLPRYFPNILKVWNRKYNIKYKALEITSENIENNDNCCVKSLIWQEPSLQGKNLKYIVYYGDTIPQDNIKDLLIYANNHGIKGIIFQNLDIKTLITDDVIMDAIKRYPNIIFLDKRGKTVWFSNEALNKFTEKELDQLSQSINNKDEKCTSALGYAIYEGKDREFVQKLIKYGIDINAPIISTNRGRSGYSAVQIAAQLGQDSLATLLLQNGAVYQDELIFDAVENNNIELTKHILKERKVANLSDIGYTEIRPLLIAAKNGKKEIVQELLEKGANPNKEGIDANTPLHYSVSNIIDACLRPTAYMDAHRYAQANFDIILTLLFHDADPTIKNNAYKKPSDFIVTYFEDTSEKEPKIHEILSLVYSLLKDGEKDKRMLRKKLEATRIKWEHERQEDIEALRKKKIVTTQKDVIEKHREAIQYQKYQEQKYQEQKKQRMLNYLKTLGIFSVSALFLYLFKKKIWSRLPLLRK